MVTMVVLVCKTVFATGSGLALGLERAENRGHVFWLTLVLPRRFTHYHHHNTPKTQQE